MVTIRIVDTVCGMTDEHTVLTLTADPGYVFSKVVFASYGLPTGDCGSYAVSNVCNLASSAAVVANLCLGRSSCSLTASNSVFGADPCRGTVKIVKVQLQAVLSGTYTPYPTAGTRNSNSNALIDL